MKRGSPGARAARWSTEMLVAFALTACAPTKVEPLQSYQGTSLPRPEIVIVTDFVTTPGEVTLDSGLGARLRNAVSGASASGRESDDDRQVTAAISKTLVEEIQKLGLPAMHSYQPAPPSRGNALIVGGQIASIDEGNRTKRNLIGLGAGHSEVKARSEVYYSTAAAGAQLIESFDVDAQSSRKPGAAETMGVGAASGRAAESALMTAGTGAAPSLSGDVTADGERLAKELAKRLGELFASQGWIPGAAGR